MLHVSIDYSRTCNEFGDVHVSAKNHNFNIPLLLGEYNIMKVMQQLKLMHDFTFAITEACLHSKLKSKPINA